MSSTSDPKPETPLSEAAIRLLEVVGEAKRAGDTERELGARVDLSAELGRTGDPRLIEHFDASLELVRREQDRRREFLLCMNVVPALLGTGHHERALELVRRAVDLAAGSHQRIQARLVLGQVWNHGFASGGQALETWREALDELDRYEARSPTRAARLVAEVMGVLGQVGKVAMAQNDADLATRVALKINPDLELPESPRSSLEGDRKRGDGIVERAREELPAILGRWQGTESQPVPEPSAAMLDAMTELAQIHGWPDAVERLCGRSKATTAPQRTPPEKGLELVALAERLASRLCDLDEAVRTAKADPPESDDLPCLCLYWLAIQDIGRAPGAFALPEIATMISTDGQSAARFARIAVAYRQQANDPRGAVHFAEIGLKRLGGGNALLRAYLHNEASLFLVDIGEPERAIEQARLAADSARAAGDEALVAGAVVNESRALSALDRHEEEVSLLESLLSSTHLDASLPAIEKARYNLELSKIMLGRSGPPTVFRDDASADQLVIAAKAALRDSDLVRAIALYERAIAASVEGGWEQESEAAWRRIELANLLRRARRHGSSAREAREAREFFERTGRGTGFLDATLSLAQALTDDPKQQARLATEALTEARRLHDVPRESDARAVHGIALASLARYDEAIAELEAALAGEPRDVGFVNVFLADLLREAGRPEAALERFRALLAKEPPDAEAVRLLIGSAEALEALDRQAEALTTLERAYRIAKDGAADVYRIQALNKYGVALTQGGRILEAMDVFNEGLAFARGAEFALEQVSLLTNFGDALDQLGQLQQAEQVLSRASRLARQIGAAQEEGRSMVTLGNVAMSAKNHSLARERYLSAVYLGEQSGDLKVQAVALDALGTIFTAERKSSRAIEYHRRAALLFDQAGAPLNQAVALLNLSQANLLLNELEPASQAFDRAKRVLSQHGLQIPHGAVELTAASIAAAHGDWADAEAHFNRALEAVERGRLEVGSPAQQRQWLQKRVAGYLMAVEAAVKAQRGDVAFSYLEWNRTRYLKSFARRRRERPEGVRLQTWLRYRAAIDHFAEARGQSRIRLALAAKESTRLLDEAEEEYRRALSAVESEGSGEAVLPGAAERPSAAALIEQLPPGIVAVSFLTVNLSLAVTALWHGQDGGEARSACEIDERFSGRDLEHLLFGDREARVEALRAGRDVDELPPEVFGWTTVSRTTLRHRLWRRTVKHVCSELGARLWPVIERVLPEGTDSIVLLPGPGFNVLPIHAAKLDGGEYAIDRYRLSYAPSLSLLGLVEERAPMPAKPSVGLATNPTEDLFFSRFEGTEIARRLPAGSTTHYTGDQATTAHVRGLMATCDVFHYAGHGAFVDEDPLESRLFCAPSDEDPGALTLGRILDTLPSIRSRWVVLSACETGQVEATDWLQDSLGLTGGLLAIGAEFVLGTFWRVGDLSSSLLLPRWYEETFGGGDGDPLAGLMRAQRWLRDDVTVGDVADQLGRWVAEQDKPDQQLEITYEFWRSRQDVDTRPFVEPVHWAAFHIAGKLWPAKLGHESAAG